MTAETKRTFNASEKAFAHARQVLPGGVNSPVRAYQAVGRDPIFIQHGKGPYVTDLDGNELIDYVGSYGPLILGHAHPEVIDAVHQAAQRGTTFGMPTEAESELAELVIDAVPSVEVVRFVNSGTEATMSAIRVARAYAGKSKIIKFVGCYHGHTDSLLVQAGSGATTLGVPSSPGVPGSITSETLLIPFNDLNAVQAAFEASDDIAGIIVEPIAGNMGCIPPAEGYLQGLRSLCDQNKAVLIFDEVMTGFRVAYGCAQSLYGVTPDMTCMGKVVGGGLPCAAYGGKEDIMRNVAPDGPVYQAGTLSGNPLAMAAGITTMKLLKQPGTYEKLDEITNKLGQGLSEIAQAKGLPLQLQRVGSMICPYFNEAPVTDYATATASDTERFGKFFRNMLENGVVLPPSQYETWFASLSHTEAEIEKTLEAADKSMDQI